MTAFQRKMFIRWFDASRYVFNQTLEYLRDTKEKIGNWKDTRNKVLNLEHIKTNTKFVLNGKEYDTPFQIKADAVKQAQESFFSTLKARKNNPDAKGPVEFNWQRKKELVKSIYITKAAIKKDGIYPRISGKGLRYHESLPEVLTDSRLIYRAGKFFLTSMTETPRIMGENQARVVSLDPGVRKFLTYYSVDSCGQIGIHDFARIQRLAHSYDKLNSRISLQKIKKNKFRMRVAAFRIQQKIRDLIADLHHKAALFLVKNYDVILLPSFETSNMVRRAKRKIRCKTARSMLTFSHYQFRKFLEFKAFEHGKTVVVVDEAYTSKTHPQTGEVENIGGRKRIKLLDGTYMDRDYVGARNILLRALGDRPVVTSSDSVSAACLVA